MTSFKDFVSNNIRSLIVVISFTVTMYVQHVNNTSRISELSTKCKALELNIADQYDKIECARIG